MDLQTSRLYKQEHRVEAHSVRRTREILFDCKVKMMKIILLVTMIGLSASAPVFLISEEPQHNPTPYAHSAVLTNSAMEEILPSELRNHFYDNPHTAAALAQQSWLTNKEMQVIDREADKIPREKIFHALHNAGLAR